MRPVSISNNGYPFGLVFSPRGMFPFIDCEQVPPLLLPALLLHPFFGAAVMYVVIISLSFLGGFSLQIVKFFIGVLNTEKERER